VKIHFLGTCSGTEPIANTHHCSLVMECGGVNYWFDAGENCAHSSHTTAQFNPRNTKVLFVSHPHIDHIGGLANLLFALDKNGYLYQKPLLNGETVLDLFFPDMKVLSAIKTVYPLSDGSPYSLRLREHELFDGEIYRDENVVVHAVHNSHLCEDGTNGWHSYSFSLEHMGLKVIYSGDVGTPGDLDRLISSGCDMLIMESGHHKVEDVCEYAKRMHVKALRLTHHGRQILSDFDACLVYVAQFSKENHISAEICTDGRVDVL